MYPEMGICRRNGKPISLSALSSFQKFQLRVSHDAPHLAGVAAVRIRDEKVAHCEQPLSALPGISPSRGEISSFNAAAGTATLEIGEILRDK